MSLTSRHKQYVFWTIHYNWVNNVLDKTAGKMKIGLNKNALTAVVSLICLAEIRSRNEEAISSTRNRIYSLKVFYFLLYRGRVFFRIFTFYLFLNWFSTRFSNDRCTRVEIHENSWASIPEMHTHHKTICIQWKLTTPDHRSFAN